MRRDLDLALPLPRLSTGNPVPISMLPMPVPARTPWGDRGGDGVRIATDEAVVVTAALTLPPNGREVCDSRDLGGHTNSLRGADLSLLGDVPTPWCHWSYFEDEASGGSDR
jgi:hypothetical protein